MTVPARLEFCQKNIEEIDFLYISKERMVLVREELKDRFSRGRTIPGTRSYHFFSPSSEHEISYKRTAEDNNFKGCFSITGEKEISQYLPKKNDYVACLYDGKWWVSLVIDVSKEEEDCRVNFMHPPGPKKNFRWPVREDICWVSFGDIICNIASPITATGRTYDISDDVVESIEKIFQEHK